MLRQCDLAKDVHWKFIDCSREPEAACFITKKVFFSMQNVYFSNNCLLIMTLKSRKRTALSLSFCCSMPRCYHHV